MLTAIVGFFSGIISGMGIGGGAILIPALIFFESVSQQTAQGINLLYFLPTAAVSLIIHFKNKNVETKTALFLGLGGLLGAVLGARMAMAISGDLLQKLFGGFLLAIGIGEVVKGFRLRNEKKENTNTKNG